MVTVTFAVSAAALVKAGAGVASTITDGTLFVGTDHAIEVWITEAESLINVITRRNWTDDYSSLNNDVKKVLQGAASDLAAINAIIYDMGGYTSREEAQTMINVLRDSAIRAMSLLKDKKVEDFIDAET